MKQDKIDIQGRSGLAIPNSLIRQDERNSRLAVFFPGLTYRNTMPVLYYPQKLLLARGYDVLSVDYAYDQIPAFMGLSEEDKVAWIGADAGALGEVLLSRAGWWQIGRYVLLYAPLAFLGWLCRLVVAARGRRHALLGALVTVLLLAVWASSVRYTNGGPFYSLRVASPAYALGTLAAGISLAAVTEVRPRFNKAPLAGLTLAVVALLPFTLALPQPSWRTAPRDWPAFASAADKTDETVRIVLRAIASSPDSGDPQPLPVILADSPGYQRRFRDAAVRVVPLWSPQVDWLFDPRLPHLEAVRRWRESGVRHLILTKWKTNLDFFNSHSRWAHAPFKVRLIGETSITAVFAIEAVE